MMHLHDPTRGRSDRQPGFTLMEVLVAIGILGVGLVAVASLFPTAILLQKQAVDESLRQQYTRSADAMLIGKGLSATVLYDFSEDLRKKTPNQNYETNPAFDIYPLAVVDIDMTNGVGPLITPSYSSTDSYLNQWSVLDRSFPSVVPDPSKRTVYWVPLVRRGVEASEYINDWHIYAFILERQSDTAVYDADDNPDNLACANPWDPDYVPKVFRLPIAGVSSNQITFAAGGNDWSGDLLIQVGDMVLGDNGLILRVSEADSNGITVNDEAQYNPTNERELKAVWFARPPAPGEPSPIRDIRLLSNNVTRFEDPSASAP